jgi:hypothetical protein
MALNPDMRASDGDRDKFADLLRENYAVGRLTQDELNERLEGVYAAKTLGGLQQLTADLPEHDLYDLPIPASQKASLAPVSRSTSLYHAGLRASWATWASVNLICFVVWALTSLDGGIDDPWFLWVAGPWGALILAGQLFGPKPKQ